ncbi:MAG: hypothetical protein HY042_05450 [Spirochaetia bacterium]|nr:hypothetical protein [Spirochaetia bacterium]
MEPRTFAAGVFSPFVFALLLPLAVSCGPPMPFDCDHQDNQDSKNECVRDMTILQFLMHAPRTTSSTPASSPGAQTESVNFTQESSNIANDTFLAAASLPLPTQTVIQAVSGKINVEGDVDIYYISYTSGTASTFSVELSKPAATSTCTAYTSFGPSLVNSGTADGSLISAGAITANVATVTLDLVSRTHLYIRCSGLLNETYTVRLAYSALNN